MGSGNAPAGQRQKRARHQKMERQQEKRAKVNTPAWLAALFAIAVVSFFVLGYVIALRETHATAWAGLGTTESSGEVATPGSSTAGTGAQANPIAVLAQGIAERAMIAARALSRGDATAGAVAMHAAMRAAAVGRDGAPEPARAAFDSASRLIRRALTTRQNGDMAGAATIMRHAARALTSFPAARPVLPSDAADYDGARLLNAAGTMVGEVDHVSIATSGEPSTATLVIGGYHHVLGFLDFGGTRLAVPVERLVFGKARTLGPTRVVLATMAQMPSR